LRLLGSDPVNQVVNAHILFNVLVLIAGIPLSRLVLRTTEALVNLNAGKKVTSQPIELEEYSALDTDVLDRPSQALANATREVIGVCDTIDVMLRRIIELYENPDQQRIDELASLDDRVDSKHARSEERRVGKECRCRWSTENEKKKRSRGRRRREETRA